MKKKLILGIAILSMIGMILPTASAGFTSYIFKEEFNENLDNSTWVNTSTPFPYELRNGRMKVFFDVDPATRYIATDPIPLKNDKFHAEFDFSVYTSRFQPNTSWSSMYVGLIFTDNRTADPIPPLGWYKGVWNELILSNDVFGGGRMSYDLRIGHVQESKTEGVAYYNQQYGVEKHLKFVVDVTIEGNETMFVHQELYRDGKLFLVHEDYMNTFDKSIVVFFSTDRYPNRDPLNGYVAMDSIEIGQYSPEIATHQIAIYEYFMTVAIIMLLISGIALFFYDKAPLLDATGVIAFYMALFLFSLFFLTYPYTIYGIPSWLFAFLPIVPIAIGVINIEKFGLFEEVK